MRHLRFAIALLLIGTTLVPVHVCCAVPLAAPSCCAAATFAHDAVAHNAAAPRGCCAAKGASPAANLVAAPSDSASDGACCCREKTPAPPATSIHLDRHDQVVALAACSLLRAHDACLTDAVVAAVPCHGPPLLARLCRLNR